MSDVKDQVIAELRRMKIKLWLPPYYAHIDASSNRAVLQSLACDLTSKIGGTKEEILVSLLTLQDHALEKLEKKRSATSTLPLVECLELKVLGLRGDFSHEIPVVSWAERVEVTDKALKFHRASPVLTAGKFLEDLAAFLKVDALRLVYRGKSISSKDDARLCDILKHGDSASPQIGNFRMMCLVSYKEQVNPDRTLIASIRQAATKLGGGASFDVTDQHGKIVPMLPSERLAFLTALGLHRLGRKRMDTTLSSALVFLLEADQEWDKVTPQWRDKVDNYGILQLDIAWVYMKLESLENLPDVTRRLELAETTLRKQVDRNFVTLALVQADMGNAVPPLSSVFCRLFLLQGVAYRFSQDMAKSKERLEWAWGLCQSLRSVSSVEQINALCEALGVTQFQAISALRRTNGNSDQAAALMEKDKADAELQNLRREEQRKLGLCKNTVDHVDLDLVANLQTVLGFTPGPPEQQEGTRKLDSNFIVAAGLLRLANNDLEKSIDIYQDVERNPGAVLQLVSDLDRSLQEQGLAKKKSSRKKEEEVDELSLATLMSMGVDESMAKKALRHSHNNMETALLWLTGQGESEEKEGEAIKSSDSFSSGESSNSSDSTSSSEANSTATDSMEEDGMTESRSKRARVRDETKEAELLLEKELGEALQERDMEQDYFGSTLDEEWSFIEKFRALD